ncbi:MAG: serine/threonine protein kinase [Planctomycetota bacterium]|jgi:serine/threonine protein kinase
MINPQNIDDQMLIDLLDGKLSLSQEEQLEQIIAIHPQIQSRLEELAGAHQWPVGSAPEPLMGDSVHLAERIEKLQSGRWEVQQSVTRSSSTDTVAIEDRIAKLNKELVGYRVVREIGRGGMGIVYEGIDESLQRPVAIKVLKELDFLESEDSQKMNSNKRLIAEAQAIAALQHENILAIYSIVFASGNPVLIQQYVDGESLGSLLSRQGRLEIDQCVSISLQIARGLVAAHERRIVHRDLKPDNILLEGQGNLVCIADFGLAKRQDSATQTAERCILGTPLYMSPEQTQKISVDERSDLFSLGVMMYRMLTGVTPFEHPDVFVVLDKIRNQGVESVVFLRTETPRWLSDLVDKLIAKRPEDRIQSARQVVSSLESKSFSGGFRNDRNARWILSSLGWLGSAAVLAGLVFLVARPNASKESFPSVSNEVSPKVLRGVWIEGKEEEFQTLGQAIQKAGDGDKILIARDLAESGIQVRGKRLRIEASAGSRPTIRYALDEDRQVAYLLRTDRDLTLRGLCFDWRPPQMSQAFEQGQFVNMLSTEFGTQLTVDGCQFRSSLQGTILGAGGSAMVTNSVFDTKLFGLGCIAGGGVLQVRHCKMVSKAGIAIFYSSENYPKDNSSRLIIEESEFDGQSAVSLMLRRALTDRIEIESRDCRFGTDYALTITRSPQRAPELEVYQDVKDWAHRLVRWQEDGCVHKFGSGYLAGRDMRQANRILTGLESLEQWQMFWEQAPGGDSRVQSAREE